MASSRLGDATSGFTAGLALSAFVDAMVRLICAGWLPQDELFGWEALPLV